MARVSRAMKASLEELARTSERSVAEHLKVAGEADESEVEKQRRLHARAARLLGVLSGGSAWMARKR